MNTFVTRMDPQGSEHRRLLSVSIASHVITDDNTINDVITQRHDLTSDMGPKRGHLGEKKSKFLALGLNTFYIF